MSGPSPYPASARFWLDEGVVLRLGPGESLAFRRGDGLRVRLAGSGGEWLASLHGRSCDEAWAHLREAVRGAPPEIDEGSWRVFLDALRLGLLRHREHAGARIVRFIHQAPPETVHLLVTDLCNYQCSCCYNAPRRPARPALSLDRWSALVDELETMGVLELAIGGGEPLLFPGLDELIRDASSRLVVNVTTNGALLDEARARRLREAGVGLVSVSFQGSEQANAGSRQEGTHEAAVHALQALGRAGVRSAVNVLLTRSLARRLSETIDRAQALGVHQVVLVRPKPRGLDDAWFASENISPSDWPEVAREVRGLPARYPGLVMTVDASFGPLFWDVPPDRLERSGFRGLGAGTVSCCVDSSGNVYPGSHFTFEAFEAGRLGERSFAEIWECSEVLDEFRRLPERLAEPCATCPIRSSCLGGCRKTAWIQADLQSPDVFCPRVFFLPGAPHQESGRKGRSPPRRLPGSPAINLGRRGFPAASVPFRPGV